MAGFLAASASNVLDELRTIFGGSRGWVLVGISVGWFLSLGTRLMYPALLPYLRAAFDLDLATAGLLLSVLWVAYAFGQLPGGMAGDVVGGRRTLVASTLVAGAALLFVAVSTTHWWLFLGTALFGLSTAFFGPTRIALLSKVYSARSGTAIGITYAAGTLGNASLPLIGSTIAAYVGWQMGFGVVVPLFLVTGAGLWLVLPSGTSESSSSDSNIRAVMASTIKSLQHPTIVLLTVVAVCGAFLFQAITGLYPSYLVEVKGLTPPQAAALFSFFFVVGIAVQLGSGVGADRIGTRRTLVVFFGLLAAGLLALPFVDGIVFLVVLSGVLSSILGYAPAVQDSIARALPDDATGSGLGALRMTFMMIGATSPFIVGSFADFGYFEEAFVALSGVALFAILVCVFLLSPES